MYRVRCPKCSRGALIVIENNLAVVKCWCGCCRPVEEIVDGMVIFKSTSPVKGDFPRVGSKLSKCLIELYVLKVGTTETLATRLLQTNSDTSSQLTVLQARGLVEKIVENKGVAGGSTWQLSLFAKKNLDEEY